MLIASKNITKTSTYGTKSKPSTNRSPLPFHSRTFLKRYDLQTELVNHLSNAIEEALKKN